MRCHITNGSRKESVLSPELKCEKVCDSSDENNEVGEWSEFDRLGEFDL